MCFVLTVTVWNNKKKVVTANRHRQGRPCVSHRALSTLWVLAHFLSVEISPL